MHKTIFIYFLALFALTLMTSPQIVKYFEFISFGIESDTTSSVPSYP